MTTPLSTREAFRPNSGHFGAMLCPVARRVTYDSENGEWRCELGGAGNPVVIAETKQLMEDFLDYLENRRTDGTETHAKP